MNMDTGEVSTVEASSDLPSDHSLDTLVLELGSVTIDPPTELDEGLLVDHHPSRSSIPVELRRSPVAAPIFKLKSQNPSVSSPSAQWRPRIPIIGTYIPTPILVPDYDINAYIPDGIADPSISIDEEGRRVWDRGDRGKMVAQVPNVMYLRTNPFWLEELQEEAEKWELDEASIEAYHRTLVEHQRINNSTLPYSLPNTNNTQSSLCMLDEQGIKEYLPEAAWLAFGELQKELLEWQLLGPTSNNKGFTCYSTGVAVINVSSGVLSVVSYVAEDGSALSEAVKRIHALALEIVVPFMIAAKSGKEQELMKAEWELRNSATIGTIANKWFTSGQINISIPGQSITISLGAFGEIHFDGGDHEYVGTIVLDCSLSRTKNSFSGGGCHLGSGTFGFTTGFSISHFLGQDLHVPVNTKIDPLEIRNEGDRRITFVIYCTQQGYSRSINGTRHLISLTDGIFLGNDTSRKYRSFHENSDTFFGVPLYKPDLPPRARPTPPPPSPSHDTLLDPSTRIQYELDIEKWKYDSFCQSPEVAQALFFALEELLSSPVTKSVEKMECKAGQELVGTGRIRLASTAKMRDRWTYIIQDPYESLVDERSLPMPSIFIDEEAALPLLARMKQQRELSKSMNPRSNSTTRGSTDVQATALPVSSIDGKVTYHSEDIASHEDPVNQLESPKALKTIIEVEEEATKDLESTLFGNIFEKELVAGDGLVENDLDLDVLLPYPNGSSSDNTGEEDLDESLVEEEREVLPLSKPTRTNSSRTEAHKGAAVVVSTPIVKSRASNPTRLQSATSRVAEISQSTARNRNQPIEIKSFELDQYTDDHLNELRNIADKLVNLNPNFSTKTIKFSDQLKENQSSFSSHNNIINFYKKEGSSHSVSLFDYISLAVIVGKKVENLIEEAVLRDLTSNMNNRLIGIGYIDLFHLLTQVIPRISTLLWSAMDTGDNSDLPQPFVHLAKLVKKRIDESNISTFTINNNLYQSIIKSLPTLVELEQKYESKKSKKEQKEEQKRARVAPLPTLFSTPPDRYLSVPFTLSPQSNSTSNGTHFKAYISNILIHIFILPTFSSLDQLGILITKSRQPKLKSNVNMDLVRKNTVDQLTQRNTLATFFKDLCPSYYAFSITEVIKIIQAPHSYLLGSSRGVSINKKLFDEMMDRIILQDTVEVRAKICAGKELFDAVTLVALPLRSTKSRTIEIGADFSRLPDWYTAEDFLAGSLHITYMNECIAVLCNFSPINPRLNPYIRLDLDKRMMFRFKGPSLANEYASIPLDKAYSLPAIFTSYILRHVSYGNTTPNILSALSPTTPIPQFNDLKPGFFSPSSFKGWIIRNKASPSPKKVANERAYGTPTWMHVINAHAAAVLLQEMMINVTKTYGIDFSEVGGDLSRKKISWTEGLKVVKASKLPLSGGKLIAPLWVSDLAGLGSFILASTEFERGPTLALGGQKGMLYVDHSWITGTTTEEITEQASQLFIAWYQFTALNIPPAVQQIIQWDPTCGENGSCKVLRAVTAGVMTNILPLDPHTSIISPLTLSNFSSFEPNLKVAVFDPTTSSPIIPFPVSFSSSNRLLTALLEWSQQQNEEGISQGRNFDEKIFEEASSCNSWAEVKNMEVGGIEFELYFKGSCTEGAEDAFRPPIMKGEKRKRKIIKCLVTGESNAASRRGGKKVTKKLNSIGTGRKRKGKTVESEEEEEDELESDDGSSRPVFELRRSARAEDSYSELLKNGKRGYGEKGGQTDEDDSSEEENEDDEDIIT